MPKQNLTKEDLIAELQRKLDAGAIDDSTLDALKAAIVTPKAKAKPKKAAKPKKTKQWPEVHNDPKDEETILAILNRVNVDLIPKDFDAWSWRKDLLICRLHGKTVTIRMQCDNSAYSVRNTTPREEKISVIVSDGSQNSGSACVPVSVRTTEALHNLFEEKFTKTKEVIRERERSEREEAKKKELEYELAQKKEHWTAVSIWVGANMPYNEKQEAQKELIHAVLKSQCLLGDKVVTSDRYGVTSIDVKLSGDDVLSLSLRHIENNRAVELVVDVDRLASLYFHKYAVTLRVPEADPIVKLFRETHKQLTQAYKERCRKAEEEKKKREQEEKQATMRAAKALVSELAAGGTCTTKA